MQNRIDYIEFLITIAETEIVNNLDLNLTNKSTKQLDNIIKELENNLDLNIVNQKYETLRLQHSVVEASNLKSDKIIERGILEKLFQKDTYHYIDKNGKKFEKYFVEEGLTRADNQAQMFETLNEADTDLILVLEHPGCSDLCLPYQNTVLSKSGKSKKHQSLASAEDDLLFRWNCKHVAIPYNAGITDIPKTKYSKTENEKIRQREALEVANAKKIRDIRTDIDKAETLSDVEKVKKLKIKLREFKKNNPYDVRRANAPIK
jgi:hypothetical protein